MPGAGDQGIQHPCCPGRARPDRNIGLGKFRGAQPKSAYPQGRRLAALFAAAMKEPTSPYEVGDQIRRIIESGSWQLRDPAGNAPNAFKWRPRTSDEHWISLHAGSDSDWAAAVKRELGLDLAL